MDRSYFRIATSDLPIKCLLYSQITSHQIKTFIIITLDPVLYYSYPALARLLVLNLQNSKPVSYGILYQKDLEKSIILIFFETELSSYLIDNIMS